MLSKGLSIDALSSPQFVHLEYFFFVYEVMIPDIVVNILSAAVTRGVTSHYGKSIIISWGVIATLFTFIHLSKSAVPYMLSTSYIHFISILGLFYSPTPYFIGAVFKSFQKILFSLILVL